MQKVMSAVLFLIIIGSCFSPVGTLFPADVYTLKDGFVSAVFEIIIMLVGIMIYKDFIE